MTVIQSNNDPNPVWDLVSAINLSEPDFSLLTPKHLFVDTTSDPGASQGRTLAVPGLPTNVLVSLNPSFDNLPFSASSIFKYVDVQSKLPSSSISTGIQGNDSLFGTGANELISGLNGDDAIYGNGGDDVLLAGGGNDIIFGSTSNEFIDGASGNDIIYGNGGKDILIGGTGDDMIYGACFADTIFGGAGNDTIYANGGGDFINSGSGFDIVWLGAEEAKVVLEKGEGFDTVNNFQLGSSRFMVGSLLSGLSFTDSASGVRISIGDDLLAVVANQTASTFISNTSGIFL